MGWFSKKKETVPPPRRDACLLWYLERNTSPNSLANCVAEALCEAESLEVAAIYADLDGTLERVGLGVSVKKQGEGEAPASGHAASHASVERIRIDDATPDEHQPVEEPWEEVLPLRMSRAEALENGWYEELWDGMWLCSPQVSRLEMEEVRSGWSSARSLLVACVAEVRSQRRGQEAVVQTELHAEFSRAATDHGAALRLLLNAVLGALGADRGAVARVDGEEAQPELLTSHGEIDERLAGFELVNLAGTWQVIITDPKALAPQAKALWALASPLRVGALVVIAGSSQPPDVFPQDTELRLEKVLTIMTELCASDDAIVQARARLSELLSGLAEVADVGAAGGSHRHQVRAICEKLGTSLGVEGEERAYLLRAAELHDCGELHFGPEADDTANAFLHPIVGAQLAETLGEPERVVYLIRSHHETRDGLGFPSGNAPPESDLSAWLLVVAELFVERRHTYKTEAEWRAALRRAVPSAFWDRWSESLLGALDAPR